VRVLLAVCGVAVAAFAAVVVSAREQGTEDASGTRPASTPEWTYGQYARVADSIERDRDALVDRGIFLEGSGVGNHCVFVSLSNPTEPNVAYIRHRYPKTCVEPRPLGPIDACLPTRVRADRGPVKVPDVLDLGLAEASRRILAADLTFTASCPGRKRNVEWVPQNPADQLVRVTAQCPRAGERVRAGSEIALLAQTQLPGGFNHYVGTAGACDSGP
jgi:hypothetical protein